MTALKTWNTGTTALSAAIKQRRPAVVQLLLDRHADPERPNCDGVTPTALAQVVPCQMLVVSDNKSCDTEAMLQLHAISQCRPGHLSQRQECSQISLLQDIGDMHVLALLQQAQVQRTAQDALECLDRQALQAEAASEQLQEVALKVCEP